MNKHKPRGYFDYVLAMDAETTGIAFNCDDPSFNPVTNETFQSIAWGLVVADANTLLPIEQLYLEIKWDGKSVWSPQAENVHGLSKQYLAENGIDSDEAVALMANLIIKYWGPTSNIITLGHNVATFDLWFMKRLMRSQQIELKFGNRHIDTMSIGFGTFGTYNSDDLFDAAGLPARDPSKHNALVDTLNALESARTARTVFQTVF